MHLSRVQRTQRLGLLLTKLGNHRFPSQKLLLQHINRNTQINIEHDHNIQTSSDKKSPARIGQTG